MGKPGTTGESPLLTRPVVMLVFTAFTSIFGFQLLLSVVPLYADEAGGGSSGAGLATGIFMLTTVLTQIQMPRILARFGYTAALAAGLLLLGVPAFLYTLAGSLPTILAVTLVRGAGFGAITVVFAALFAELAPPERRGEALGLLGLAITVPTIFSNSLGLWLSDRFGFGTVFLLGGLLPLLGLVAILGIRHAVPYSQTNGSTSFLAGMRRGALRRLVLLFCATTMASGVIVTFLPLAAPGSGPFSAAGALLVVGVVTAISRWWAGRFGDRHDARLLLAPGLIACAAGTAVMPWGGVVMISGAAIFGAGFGVVTNATLILTMQRVSKTEYGLGSTLWNAAFDAGTGLGAFAFGFVVSALGFTWAFILCAILVASALVLVYQDYSDSITGERD